MSRMRPLVIANPAARSGRTEGQLPLLLDELRASIGAVDVELTAHPGHATELAAEAVADGRELVVSVGGDGVLNEVVNGLLTGRRGDVTPPLPAAALPRLGILAAGTGGDFGRSLGIEHERAAYIATIARGRERLIDAGLARFAPRRKDDMAVLRRFTMSRHRLRRTHPRATPPDGPQRSGLLAERYFLNVLSAGIGGLVDRYAAAIPAAVGGRAAYGLATMAAVATCRRRKLLLTATLPGGSTTSRPFDGYALVIGNGQTFGGGMRVAPDARPDDGLLEVLTFETPTKFTMVRHFLSIYSGTHLTKPGVAHFACTRLELRVAEEPGRDATVTTGQRAALPAGDLFPLDVDGDNLGDLPLTVEVVPQALRVLA